MIVIIMIIIIIKKKNISRCESIYYLFFFLSFSLFLSIFHSLINLFHHFLFPFPCSISSSFHFLLLVIKKKYIAYQKLIYIIPSRREKIIITIIKIIIPVCNRIKIDKILYLRREREREREREYIGQK